MAGYLTPGWTNDASPALDASNMTGMGEAIEIAEHPYGVCSTASSTAAKTVTVDFSGTLTLFTGLTVRIKFSNANTVANPTLNVNSTGAVSIMAHGTTTANIGAWGPGEVVTFVYDGTNWVIAGEGERKIITVSLSSISSLPQTVSSDAITAQHVVIACTLSNPNAQIGNWTCTTSQGSLTISGTIHGTTNITLQLGQAVTT